MNDRIIVVLNQLLKQYESEGEKPFKIKAIKKGLKNIKEHSVVIPSGSYARKNIAGVGKGLSERIDEIIKTGTLSELVTDDKTSILAELSSVFGIGPKKAKSLYDDGYHSVNDLRNGISTGTLTLPHHTLVGLTYYDDMEERIPRGEVTKLGKILGKAVKRVDTNLVFEICGSYRRGARTCGDMDVLMSHPNIEDDMEKHDFLETLVDVLTEMGFLIDHLTMKGSKKYMGLCRLGDNGKARRIDIRCVDWSAYFPAMIYFTGSKNFNIKIRRKALELGYSLSEYGFKKESTGELVTVNSEEELFDIINEDYVPPTLREMGK